MQMRLLPLAVKEALACDGGLDVDANASGNGNETSRLRLISIGDGPLEAEAAEALCRSVGFIN